MVRKVGEQEKQTRTENVSTHNDLQGIASWYNILHGGSTEENVEGAHGAHEMAVVQENIPVNQHALGFDYKSLKQIKQKARELGQGPVEEHGVAHKDNNGPALQTKVNRNKPNNLQAGLDISQTQVLPPHSAHLVNSRDMQVWPEAETVPPDKGVKEVSSPSDIVMYNS